MISLLAFLFAACSATAWYAASPHCLWRTLRGRAHIARVAGGALALLSLAVWISVLGVAAGLCAMLASGMLALIVLPWLALLTGSPDAAAVMADKA